MRVTLTRELASFLKNYGEALAANIAAEKSLDPIRDGTAQPDPDKLYTESENIVRDFALQGIAITKAEGLVAAAVDLVAREGKDIPPDSYALPSGSLLRAAKDGIVLSPQSAMGDPFLQNIILAETEEHTAGIEETAADRVRISYIEYEPLQPAFYGLAEPDPRIPYVPKVMLAAGAMRFPSLTLMGGGGANVTPFEIYTSRPAVEAAHGKVLLIGAGLGRLAWILSEKPDVSAITVLEQDNDTIALFQEQILPQFRHADKIKVMFNARANRLAQLQDGLYDLCVMDTDTGFTSYARLKHETSDFTKTRVIYRMERQYLLTLARAAFLSMLDSAGYPALTITDEELVKAKKFTDKLYANTRVTSVQDAVNLLNPASVSRALDR